MAPRRPAEVFPPGDILREELEARGWSQLDLAEIIGRHPNTVNEIITGKRRISPEMARSLAAALGTSPDLWMNLDAAYQLAQVRNDDADLIARRARLYSKAPVKEMVRRGWIESSDNIDVLETRVCRFLQIASIDDEPELPRHAARKSTAYDQPPTPAQTAWFFRAQQLAQVVQAAPFSAVGLRDVIGKLRSLTYSPEETGHVPRILADVGIRFVVVQPMPSSRIDGACFTVDEAPAIAMSLRFNRIDNFWFVLFHELNHVAKGNHSLDSDLERAAGDKALPPEERAANTFAAETLIPTDDLTEFVSEVGPCYSAQRIELFAQRIGVHPAIVVGQLQHRGEIPYSSFRKMMVPVRDWIVPAALTDGWDVASSAQA